jgi:sulfotransferase family protein
MVGHMDQSPYLFIVGCQRSGTTLLQRMLDNHPLLAVANEARFMLRIAENGAGESDLPLTNEMKEWVLHYRRFPKLALSEAAVCKAADSSHTYGEFVSALYVEYGNLHGKVLAGEKTPRYVRYLPLLHAIFPWVKTIHLIRDGRNVALSTLEWARGADKGPGRFRLWRKSPVAACALWWRWQVSSGRLDGADLGAQHYQEVKYEDVVEAPEETLRKITEFLKLAYAPEMLTYYEGKVRYGTHLSAKSAWLPPTPGLRNWRTEMDQKDVELFEAIAGDLLSAVGYERAFKTISPQVARSAEQCRNRWETEMAVCAGF